MAIEDRRPILGALEQEPRAIAFDRAADYYDRTRLVARSEAQPVVPVLADARALPFADGRFDAVVGVHVFHLLPEWQHVLGEVRRVRAAILSRYGSLDAELDLDREFCVRTFAVAEL